MSFCMSPRVLYAVGGGSSGIPVHDVALFKRKSYSYTTIIITTAHDLLTRFITIYLAPIALADGSTEEAPSTMTRLEHDYSRPNQSSQQRRCLCICFSSIFFGADFSLPEDAVVLWKGSVAPHILLAAQPASRGHRRRTERSRRPLPESASRTGCRFDEPSTSTAVSQPLHLPHVSCTQRAASPLVSAWTPRECEPRPAAPCQPFRSTAPPHADRTRPHMVSMRWPGAAPPTARRPCSSPFASPSASAAAASEQRSHTV